MTSKSKVSIIIICEKWNHFLKESLPHYENLDYPNFEILVFSTKAIAKNFTNVKFFATPHLKNNPAEKRDLAMKHASGEFYAFIDDDAFPTPNWLNHAIPNFRDKNIVAVAGPGITPPNANLLEKASGWISASPLGGFGNTYRFIPQKRKVIDDYPSMNLIVRANDFKKIGGFDSNYYPGEDTKLCMDLTYKLKKQIIYDPKVLVYHHIRPLFKKYLIQNGRYGLHRGYFAKILPKTSRRLFYFIPSFFVIGLITGLSTIFISILNPLKLVYLQTLLLYTILLLANSIWTFFKSNNLIISLLTIPGIFLIHTWYGIKFIQGFLSKSMHDKYGRIEG